MITPGAVLEFARLDHNEDMEKIGGQHLRRERCVLVLEDDANTVVANMAFAFYLLSVPCGVRQHGGHVEHDLAAGELLIDRILASVVGLVQSTSKSEKRRQQLQTS